MSIGISTILIPVMISIIMALIGHSLSFTILTRDTQSVNAANTVTNQTIAVNTNCDQTSTCTISSTQSVGIGIGDDNTVNQNLNQRNELCTVNSICEIRGSEEVSIAQSHEGQVSDSGSGTQNNQIDINDGNVGNHNSVEQDITQQNTACSNGPICQIESQTRSVIGDSFKGTIIDFPGQGNRNNQTSTVSSSSNNNILSQEELQQTQFCQSLSFCRNIISGFGGVGFNIGGSVEVFGSNNTNIQNIIKDGSASENIMSSNHDQQINNCQLSCENGVSSFSSIGTSSGGVMIVGGSNNSNTQQVTQLDSAKNNHINTNSEQENSFCGSGSTCGNFVNPAASIGSISLFGPELSEFGNNNTNIQTISQSASSKGNTINVAQNQKNTDCKNGLFCFQTMSFSSSIGTIRGSPIGDGGNNNTNTQNFEQINSNNENSISASMTQNSSHCLEQTICGSDSFVHASIGGEQFTSALGIGNQGNNNKINQSKADFDSNNLNKLVQNSDQINNNCKDNTVCGNHLSLDTKVGSSTIGVIENAGENNSISSSLINTNSNNENEITQVVHQTNEACSLSSLCDNSATAISTIGSNFGTNVVINENNLDIQNTTIVADKNNKNILSQSINQNNLCKDASQCQNTGAVLVNLNGENNQEVGQSIFQTNLCLTNSICSNNGEVVGGSGSNTQSNTCVQGSSCSNTGTNNKNTCTNGSTCNNFGVNTKVISAGDNTCESAAEGTTTICSHGRIVIRAPEPNLIP